MSYRQQVLQQVKALVLGTTQRYEFALCVRDSGVSGRGVFLDHGVSPKGSVVTLYPGVYYPPPPLWAIGSQDTASGDIVSSLSLRLDDTTKNNDYLISLEATGGAIDAYTYQRLGTEAAFADLPLLHCCGHLLNHPNAGQHANCDVVDFSWKEVLGDDKGDLGESLRPERVNPIASGLWVIDAVTSQRHYTDGTASAADAPNTLTAVTSPRPPLAGLAIVATRPIKAGEPLLLDYKLRPPHPPWYTPAA